MPPRERLFRLEIDFHRQLKSRVNPGENPSRVAGVSFLRTGFPPAHRGLDSVETPATQARAITRIRHSIFARRLRIQACPPDDIGDLHTSYALQNGYDMILRSTGPVAARDIERLKNRFLLTADSREMLSARNSVKQLLGFTLHHSMTRA